MANSDKNIIITPYVSDITQPQMTFVGQGNDPIYLKVLDGITGTGATAGGALSIEGSAGQLFSVVNRLGTGSIFSVNDISGFPIIDANANGTLSLAPSFGNVGVGLTGPTNKFQVTGNAYVSGLVTAVSGISAAGGTFSGLILANAGINASGATFNGPIYTDNIFDNTGVLSINDKTNTRVVIGDYSNNANSTFIYLRDNISTLYISNPFGVISLGDPNGIDNSNVITYDTPNATFSGNGTSTLDGFQTISADATILENNRRVTTNARSWFL